MKPKIEGVKTEGPIDPCDVLLLSYPDGWLLVRMTDGKWWETDAEEHYRRWAKYHSEPIEDIEEYAMENVTAKVHIPGATEVWMGEL